MSEKGDNMEEAREEREITGESPNAADKEETEEKLISEEEKEEEVDDKHDVADDEEEEEDDGDVDNDDDNREESDENSHQDNEMDVEDDESVTKNDFDVMDQFLFLYEDYKKKSTQTCGSSGYGPLATSPFTSIHVEGLGELPVPLQESDLIRLANMTQEKARFGEYSIDPRLISIPSQPDFFDHVTAMARKALIDYMGVDVQGMRVKAQVRNFVVYKKGAYFVNHREPEDKPGYFATYQLQLPVDTGFTTSRLSLHHMSLHNRGEEIEFPDESSKTEFFELVYYNDHGLVMTKIDSGWRVVLTFDLVWEQHSPTQMMLNQNGVVGVRGFIASLKSMGRHWGDVGPSQRDLIALLLENRYTSSNFNFASLKGEDSAIAQSLIACADEYEIVLRLDRLHMRGPIPFKEAWRCYPSQRDQICAACDSSQHSDKMKFEDQEVNDSCLDYSNYTSGCELFDYDIDTLERDCITLRYHGDTTNSNPLSSNDGSHALEIDICTDLPFDHQDCSDDDVDHFFHRLFAEGNCDEVTLEILPDKSWSSKMNGDDDDDDVDDDGDDDYDDDDLENSPFIRHIWFNRAMLIFYPKKFDEYMKERDTTITRCIEKLVDAVTITKDGKTLHYGNGLREEEFKHCVEYLFSLKKKALTLGNDVVFLMCAIAASLNNSQVLQQIMDRDAESIRIPALAALEKNQDGLCWLYMIQQGGIGLDFVLSWIQEFAVEDASDLDLITKLMLFDEEVLSLHSSNGNGNIEKVRALIVECVTPWIKKSNIPQLYWYCLNQPPESILFSTTKRILEENSNFIGDGIFHQFLKYVTTKSSTHVKRMHREGFELLQTLVNKQFDILSNISWSIPPPYDHYEYTVHSTIKTFFESDQYLSISLTYHDWNVDEVKQLVESLFPPILNGYSLSHQYEILQENLATVTVSKVKHPALPNTLTESMTYELNDVATNAKTIVNTAAGLKNHSGLIKLCVGKPKISLVAEFRNRIDGNFTAGEGQPLHPDIKEYLLSSERDFLKIYNFPTKKHVKRFVDNQLRYNCVWAMQFPVYKGGTMGDYLIMACKDDSFKMMEHRDRERFASIKINAWLKERSNNVGAAVTTIGSLVLPASVNGGCERIEGEKKNSQEEDQPKTAADFKSKNGLPLLPEILEFLLSTEQIFTKIYKFEHQKAAEKFASNYLTCNKTWAESRPIVSSQQHGEYLVIAGKNLAMKKPHRELLIRNKLDDIYKDRSNVVVDNNNIVAQKDSVLSQSGESVQNISHSHDQTPSNTGNSYLKAKNGLPLPSEIMEYLRSEQQDFYKIYHFESKEDADLFVKHNLLHYKVWAIARSIMRDVSAGEYLVVACKNNSLSQMKKSDRNDFLHVKIVEMLKARRNNVTNSYVNITTTGDSDTTTTAPSSVPTAAPAVALSSTNTTATSMVVESSSVSMVVAEDLPLSSSTVHVMPHRGGKAEAKTISLPPTSNSQNIQERAQSQKVEDNRFVFQIKKGLRLPPEIEEYLKSNERDFFKIYQFESDSAAQSFKDRFLVNNKVWSVRRPVIPGKYSGEFLIVGCKDGTMRNMGNVERDKLMDNKMMELLKARSTTSISSEVNSGAVAAMVGSSQQIITSSSNDHFPASKEAESKKHSSSSLPHSEQEHPGNEPSSSLEEGEIFERPAKRTKLEKDG